jgi:hypothetical protein
MERNKIPEGEKGAGSQSESAPFSVKYSCGDDVNFGQRSKFCQLSPF